MEPSPGPNFAIYGVFWHFDSNFGRPADPQKGSTLARATFRAFLVKTLIKNPFRFGARDFPGFSGASRRADPEGPTGSLATSDFKPSVRFASVSAVVGLRRCDFTRVLAILAVADAILPWFRPFRASASAISLGVLAILAFADAILPVFLPF